MKKIKVLSVNISEKKGTIKLPVPSITLTKNGVEGDAHSGPWNRQVSMLGMESIRKFEKEANRRINYGEFAENITTEGIELWKCQPLDRFIGEEVELEVTQIGKECHGTSCAIFKEVGNCVMPKEGIFARVRDKGYARSEKREARSEKREARSEKREAKPETWNLKPETTLLYKPKVFSARIITLSDRAFKGEYEDKSGPRVEELLKQHFESHKAPGMSHEKKNTSHEATGTSYEAQGMRHEKKEHFDPRPSTLDPDSSSFVPRLSSLVSLLPDDPEKLRTALTEAIETGTDFIFTTGGTGIGHRDFTPDVVRPILDKEIPGIMEMIRMRYGAEKYQALLSRSVAGVAGNTLIFTLPGSVRAVNEYMEEILKSLMHMIYMLNGLDSH